jgi:hypothetical protein
MEECLFEEIQMIKMDDEYFAEGLTRTANNEVY